MMVVFVYTYGCSQVSMNLDMFSVMLLQLGTIGLMLIGFLCIFFRKYNLEVLCLGGLQYSNQLDCISPVVCSRSSFVVDDLFMFFGIVVVEFLVYCKMFTCIFVYNLPCLLSLW